MRRGSGPGIPGLIAALIVLGGAHCSIHEKELGETFDLEGAHGELSCSDCHTDDNQDLPPRSCTGCHDGDLPAPHWDDECDECHSQQAWDDLEYVHEEYELTGAHREADCGGCHEVAWQSETSCLACHDEDRPLGHIVHECVFCHTTESWEEPHWNHEEFPLLGGHTALLCGACHVQGYFGSDVPEKDCVSCHEEQTPPDHDPRPCEACHNIFDWDDVTEPD